MKTLWNDPRNTRISRNLAPWIASCSLVTLLFNIHVTPAQGATLASEQALMTALNQQVAASVHSKTLHQHEQAILSLQLQHVEQSMQSIESTIQMNAKALNRTKAQLAVEGRQLKKTQASLVVCKNAVRSQVVAMYENGTSSYLSVLFNATSWSDLLTRFQFMTMLADTTHAYDVRLSALEHRVSAEQQQTLTTKESIQTRQAENETLLQADSALKAQKAARMQNVHQLLLSDQSTYGKLESQIHLTQQQIQVIIQETAAAEAKMKSSQYVQQTTSTMQSIPVTSLISYAEQFMGTPYVWGGTQPGGFDCSGYVQYVFAHEGITLPRTSEEQYAVGIDVSSSALAPGDLVFFSTYAPGATHVGIYIGNGLMVDAQDYGVSIDNINNSYWAPKYIGARQVVKSSNG